MKEMFFNYRRRPTAQVRDIQELLDVLGRSYTPEVVIEIGSYMRGFSQMLGEMFPKSKVLSYDIKPPIETMRPVDTDSVLLLDKKWETIEGNVQYFIRDCHSAEFVEELKGKLSIATPNLVFIDGGQKAKEFNLIAPVLMSGDVIMAHDFGIDTTHFDNFIRKPGKWLHCECTEKMLDISQVKRHALFNVGWKYIWGIYEKL